MVYVFANIYYSNPSSDPDRSFERAARWLLRHDTDNIDEIIGVKTKQDFVNAWTGIIQQANHNNAPVLYVNVFSHASKQMDDLDGLEFADGPGGTTLTQADIQSLPRLPWSQNHEFNGIYLHGCNTGLIGQRGWCPADAFAKSQGVTAYGEKGFAYFSKNRETYQEISPSDTEVHLYAYNRMRNNPTGDGRVMNFARYSP